ncbi:MAG: hypothetical protein AVDCRST_MAG67-1612, partial [uncultured Solirubrobacteraceae bacterium]
WHQAARRRPRWQSSIASDGCASAGWTSRPARTRASTRPPIRSTRPTTRSPTRRATSRRVSRRSPTA